MPHHHIWIQNQNQLGLLSIFIPATEHDLMLTAYAATFVVSPLIYSVSTLLCHLYVNKGLAHDDLPSLLAGNGRTYQGISTVMMTTDNGPMNDVITYVSGAFLN